MAVAVFAATMIFARTAFAAVSADEAQRLSTTLTPMGAEKAGNSDGSIPAWEGGYRLADPKYRQGDPRPDPFAGDARFFSITGANARDHADRLPEGAKHLLAKFSNYRMDVYPTHRSAAVPQTVYANIARNATQARAAALGIAYGVEGAAGGIPFPIPKNGFEVVWNHLLAFWGPARELDLKTYVVAANGNAELTSAYREISDFPYYYPNATPQSIDGYYFKTKRLNYGPPAKAGQGYLTWQPIDTNRFKFPAWRVLPREHRVRKGPSLSYDTPDPDASGYQNLDEYYVFFGGLDRYDFKLVGKQEMFVPYNNNRFYLRPTREILGPNHANPDTLRYELHRVWVVEGTLVKGKNHVAPKRRLYIDEDTWLAVYSDSWDEDGELWKFGHGTMYLMPDVPAVVLGAQFVYDLTLGGYVYSFAFNDEKLHYNITQPHPQSAFTPSALAAQSIR